MHRVFDNNRVDFALVQDKGPHIFPALAKILEMLARRLPVGTPHEHGQFLQVEQRLAVCID